MIPWGPILNYDRNGQPITWERCAELRTDYAYRRVAEDTVGDYWVSTVWLGINHQFFDGPPLIFETMVFAQDDGNDDLGFDRSCWRWCTEEQAQAGHQEIVTLIRYELELTSAEGSP